MPKEKQELHVHLVSDATGETTSQLVRAGLAQFGNVKTKEHIWTLVRTPEHLESVNKAVKKYGGVVFYSIIAEDLRQRLESICREHKVPSVSVLDHVIHALSKILGEPQAEITGGQYRMDKAYFERIEALEFAIQHDDGQGFTTVRDADILLVGVSRSSKTPTSIYLAHRGYRVANYPLVPGVELPLEMLPEEGLFVVGLIKDAKSLSQIRRNRLLSMHEREDSEYADIEKITEEIANARKLFATHDWPVIDVTRRSVEETAAAIINLYHKWLKKNRK